MVTSLEDLLNRSVTQTLGLSDILEKRAEQSRRFGQAKLGEGAVAAAGILKEATVKTVQMRAKEEARLGAMSSIITLLGAAVGGIGIPGVMAGGGLSGAATGARVASAISGGRAEGQGIAAGFQMGAELGLKGEELALKKKSIQAVKEKTQLSILQRLGEVGGQKSKQEDTLRKEFNPIQKNFDTISKMNDKIKVGLQRGTAAGDLSSIFSFMKILDPTSVVREGEQATAQNATGVEPRIRNLYNQILTGVKLTPEQRIDFGETAKSLFVTEQKKYDANIAKFSSIAQNRELDLTNIFGAGRKIFNSVEEAERANLPKGTVVYINGRRGVIE